MHSRFGGWEITAWERNAAGESRFGERRKTLGTVSNKRSITIHENSRAAIGINLRSNADNGTLSVYFPSLCCLLL